MKHSILNRTCANPACYERAVIGRSICRSCGMVEDATFLVLIGLVIIGVYAFMLTVFA